MAEIIWQDRAVEDFESIQDYLNQNFGEYQLRKFTQRVFDFLELLSSYPTIGPLQVKELEIRGFVISAQTTLLYKYSDDKIYILSLIDNRSDHLLS